MKKVILFIMLISTYLFGYNFPIKDPYSATIIGSSTMMMAGVSEEIPIKNYKIKTEKKIPEAFWYAKDFEFSLVKQKKEAPLIFLLAGTGSDYKSMRIKYLERIFYDAGYNIISISSPMSAQFLISVSKDSAPGLLLNDNKDIYTAMKMAYEKVKNEIKVNDFYLMGYSLGGTNAGVVSYIDEQEKFFNFKRVFMLNPAVDLYKSAKILDGYLDDYTKGDGKKVEALIDSTLAKIEYAIKNNMKNDYSSMNSETIYTLIQGDFLTLEEKKAYIGLAFRLTSIDLNFISDVLTKSNVYTNENEKINKFSNMFSYFEKVNFANFEDYVNKIGYPYYHKIKTNFSMKNLEEEANLSIIEDYLKNSSKIAAVTNADELILTTEDFNFLKNTFGDRLIIYPNGGHCGNMYYKENVDIMLNFLKNGVLNYE